MAGNRAHLRAVPAWQAADVSPPHHSGDLLAQWSQFLTAGGAAPNTVKIRLAAIHALIAHAQVSDPLQLTPQDVVAWLARDIKPHSRVTYFRCIRAWQRWLTSQGHTAPGSDLLAGLPQARPPSPAARPISDDDVRALLTVQLPPRVRAYVLLALYEALRVHEIAKIQAEDFDLDHGWLTVHGKGDYTALIPVHPRIVELADQMTEVGYWFPNRSGEGHVTALAVSASIGGALQKIGCRATAHQLRDTAATRMQRDGRDIRVTQAMLRHKSLQSTMKYTAVSDNDLQAAAGRLDWG